MRHEIEKPLDSLDVWREAVVEDFSLLAFLHDREPTRKALEELRLHPFRERLGLVLQTPESAKSLKRFDDALGELPNPLDQESIDALAADYADIYLTYRYRASPTESVWLDTDHLERQEPTFRVQSWYRRHGLRSDDWARRPDDHLVLQLRFLAFFLERSDADLHDAARFLDEHLLRWIDRFAEQVERAGALPFFVSLAWVTANYVDEVRAHLTEMTGIAPPETEMQSGPAETDGDLEEDFRPYLPGAEPGW